MPTKNDSGASEERYYCFDCKKEMAKSELVSSRDTGNPRDNIYPGDYFCPTCGCTCYTIEEALAMRNDHNRRVKTTGQ